MVVKKEKAKKEAVKEKKTVKEQKKDAQKEEKAGAKSEKAAKKVSDKSKKIKKDKDAAAADGKKTLKVGKDQGGGSKMTRRFNKLRLRKSDLDGSKGIVYVGHLPQGFEEDGLKKFFEQFGKIQKIRLSRSKKTGRSRGYAFIEFKVKKEAEIAVQTMDKYIIFGKQLDCHMIEPEMAHKDMFKNGNRDWVFVPTALKFRKKKNEELLPESEGGKTLEQRVQRVQGLLEKEKEKRIRLKELGIEYDFPGYQGIVDGVKAPAKKERKSSSSTAPAPKTARKLSKDSAKESATQQPQKTGKSSGTSRQKKA